MMRIATAHVAALLSLALMPSHVHANPAVNVQVFRPSLASDDLLTVLSSSPGEHLSWSVGLMTHYGKDALIFHERSTRDLRDAVVEDQLTLELGGGVSLFDRLSIGVALPLFIVNEGQAGGFVPNEPVSGFAVGDLRLSPKVGIITRPAGQDGFGLGAGLELGLPTGDADAFVSDGFTALPAVVVDYAVGPVLLALNVGYLIRGEETLFPGLDVGSELIVRLGAEVDIVPDVLSGIGEIYGATEDFSEGGTSHMEGVLAARVRIAGPDLVVTAGGGTGFLRGYGNTAYRLFAGLAYVPAASEPELELPIDTDLDGVLDTVDRCLTEAEDPDGFEDSDGCPDPDNDGDGVNDANDACPDEAEDADGLADEDGCPEDDVDGDGVVDTSDGCPTEPEDADGHEDEDGCPDPDNDGDGILDANDDCPADPDNVCGVKVDPCEIHLTQTVDFRYQSAEIEARSGQLLDSIAQVLKVQQWISRVEVQGHTDSVGPDGPNLLLSQQRADAVAAALIARGITAERLTSKGYGESQPRAENTTPEGRDKNRRVQLIITAPSQERCVTP